MLQNLVVLNLLLEASRDNRAGDGGVTGDVLSSSSVQCPGWREEEA